MNASKRVHPPTMCQVTASEYREDGITFVMPSAPVKRGFDEA
jgi:hypothetical protein